MRPRWCKVDEAFFAAATAGHNGSYHLTVEQLPDHDGWDWTVWRPGEAPEVARHGQALSVEAALRAAEATVRHWDETAASVCRVLKYLLQGARIRFARRWPQNTRLGCLTTAPIWIGTLTR